MPSASGRDVIDNELQIEDKYWLLRYPNTDVDTLHIHQVFTKNPNSFTFTFFINENEIEGTNYIYDEYAITMQK